VITVTSGLLVVGPVSPAAAQSPVVTAAFEPLATPVRLVDTRPTGALAGGQTLAVPVAGDAPRPAPGAATAVVLNVTVVGPAGPGYWTVWPRGQRRPDASNLNVDELQALSGPSLTVTNLVTVPLTSTGAVDVFTSAGGHVIVDLLGYYRPAATSTSGRFQPLATPARVLDTRGGRIFDAGERRDVTVPGAAGASAVALNVTAITAVPGYWQLFAAGSPVPPTSNLNSPVGLGAVVANQVIVPVDARGVVTVHSQAGGHLIVDLVGTYTGAGAPTGTEGLFVPVPTPTRVLDTRNPFLNPLPQDPRPLPGWSLEVPVSTSDTGGRQVSAVALNVTINEALLPGYVSVTTAGANPVGSTSRSTSTLNVIRPAQTLANHAIVPVSARGFDVFTQGGGQLIADLAGFFLGSPRPAPHGVRTNTDPTPNGCLGYPALAIGRIVIGSSPDAVRRVQRRLLDLGFWHLGVDGGYGLTTSQAVMAFQKWKGLPATSVVDDATAVALTTTLCRPTAGRTSGDFFEVDKGKQIAMVVRGGTVFYVFNVSTGNGESYDEEDQKNAGSRVIGVAITPTGEFRTYREHDVPRYEGNLGTLYRPKFVVGGVAVHGARNVPNYPASHGCIRVVNPVMDLIWAQNLLPLRSRVWIHD
jgi:hypothetical protein